MKYHPKSYRPDLPGDGMHGLAAWADSMVKRDMERTYGVTWRARETEIRPRLPHPRSYRPDLHGTGPGAVTKRDREYWSQHPLTYLSPDETAAWQADYARQITDPSRHWQAVRERFLGQPAPRVDWRQPTQYKLEEAAA